ncbi:MAG: TetR family transcriptional regulator [Armatimonadetes bacterium]|nr:TetR family transcriptional regulator [Armatimonadota bacterium]
MVEPADEARPRKRGSREESRHRLVEAAIDQIREHGAAALTTVSVTRAAGMAQSGFYQHFRDLDECKAAAAHEVARELREFLREQHARSKSPGDLEELTANHRAILELFTSHGHLPDMVVRCRYDLSPLGDAMRQLLSDVRTVLADNLAEAFGVLGLPDLGPARFAVTAELIVGMVLAAGESLLDGRATDVDLIARELTAAVAGIGLAAAYMSQ